MYYLMNKDTVIETFEIDGIGEGEYCTDIVSYNQSPFWLTDINDWLDNRSIAKHRKHIQKILSEANAKTLSGFISLTRCLSVNDTLWVKSDNESDLCWSDVSLYMNDFNDVISRLAFDGTGLCGHVLSVTSPELTTDGTFDKCWIKDGDVISLIKAGSNDTSISGLEPYSEVLASQVFTALDGSAVSYDLCKYHSKIVSKCKLFTNDKYGYKPAACCGIVHTRLPILLREMSKYGSEDTFRRMIVGDAITMNMDRHFGNFGLLVDNDTFEKVSMAPIFDYNLAMFPYASWSAGFTDMEGWIEKCGPRLGSNYYEAADYVMTSEIRSDIINLKDLELTIECDDKFDRQRLEICNRFKNLQIDKLLGNRVQFDFTDIRRKYESSIPSDRLSKLARRRDV